MNRTLKLSLLVLIIITLISTASYCSAPYDTETAHIINVRKTIDGGGYLLRNETVVKAPKSGLFEPAVKSGDRVSKGAQLGIFTAGDIDDKLANDYAEVTRRINEIKQADGISSVYSSDEARIYSVMKSTTAAIRQNCYEGNYLGAAENTRQLEILVEKKHSVENASAQDRVLVELETEKYDLEKRLGGIRENVYSPFAGYFFTELDGLEGTYLDSDMSLLTNEGITQYEKTLEEYKKDSSPGKITDSYVWYLASSIHKDDAALIGVGDAVTVSIDGSAFVKATVLALNPDDSDYVAMVIKSDRNIPGLYEKRTAQFEICIEEHTGLYVPSAAIRVVDDITGVYVMGRNNDVEFKCVNILFEEDKYYIVSKDYIHPEECPYESLSNYDNVLVNPEVKKLDRKPEKKS